MARIRNLVIVLGDQLDHASAAFDGFDPTRDLVWMAEVAAESTHVLSHKARTVYFLSAMRHFAEELLAKSFRLEYRKLDAPGNQGALDLELLAAIKKFNPAGLVVIEAGEYRVEQMLLSVSADSGIPLDVRPDRHFYCSRAEFAAWAKNRTQLRMEFFYRAMRKKTNILMDHGQPVGNQWNFDAQNRKSFGKQGPAAPAPLDFPPDEITCEVIRVVEAQFPNHPGSLNCFALPVTAAQAQAALDDFVAHRLPSFGNFQDAMWTGEPILFHARISAAMNVKLLNPRAVVMAVEDAYHRGHAPLPGVEGFIRQIIGWREYVRGIYWNYMPAYLQGNALNAIQKLPDFYWDGQTDMNRLRHALGQTLQYGYAHHIQRLMVTGLYALLFAVEPVEVHKWYLAIYWDAVEWVELPNTVGMSQFADGGLMASKPYIASGKYISRMSNYCQGCRYDPAEATGENACPFTTLYWDFLMQHQPMLEKNQRMLMQVRNLTRLTPARKQAIRDQAAHLRKTTPAGSY